jgi:hypothetical protein
VLVLDPYHDDAMAHVNLLLRVNAALEDSLEAAHADIAMADQWVKKSLVTAQANAARRCAGTG